MYKAELFALLTADCTTWFEYEGKHYILQGIMRESGSGYQFNVHVCDTNNVHSTIYIRTLD